MEISRLPQAKRFLLKIRISTWLLYFAFCSLAGRRDYLDLLLDYGADLSLPDVKGFCPVMPCLANGISIGLLRYVVNLMEKKGVRYNISSWPYLKMAFQWQG